MILVVDNYDSFTFNLVQLLAGIAGEVVVRRNDALAVADIAALAPAAIVLSPGPGDPSQAGVCAEVVLEFGGRIPMLGVCLGMQVLAQALGGRTVRAPRPMHGKSSLVFHDQRGVLRGIPSPFEAMRYHSLLVERASLPTCFEVSAWTESGEVMAIRHRQQRLDGVQFHPESFLTQHGRSLLQNFVEGPRDGR